MQTPRIIITLLLTLCFPLTAVAGHNHQAKPTHARGSQAATYSSSGYLVVENPNLQTLLLRLDGRQIGEVRPDERARFGPFREGEHRLVTRLKSTGQDLNLSLSMDQIVIDQRRPARVKLPVFSITLLELQNTWVEGMDVRINGKVRGRVEGQSMLTLASRSPARVEFLDQDGRAVQSETIDGAGLARTSVRLIAPARAAVKLVNPNTVELTIVNARGRTVATLAAQSAEIVWFRSGRKQLTAVYGDREIDRNKLLASPFENNTWTVATPKVAPVSVRNFERGSAALFVGDRFIGSIPGRTTGVFDLPVGLIELRVRVQDERRTHNRAQRLEVDPFNGASVRILIGATGRRGGERRTASNASGSCGSRHDHSGSRRSYTDSSSRSAGPRSTVNRRTSSGRH